MLRSLLEYYKQYKVYKQAIGVLLYIDDNKTHPIGHAVYKTHSVSLFCITVTSTQIVGVRKEKINITYKRFTTMLLSSMLVKANGYKKIEKIEDILD